ncbi:hypothetical protein TWF730_007040 [Orbilia blumenaviensis]|uniref:Uncharacterized protein n=1 Tax=Orbilia blumenaviensis TaxID=1796055 RepID=A0AAV9VMA7_9PEZI
MWMSENSCQSGAVGVKDSHQLDENTTGNGFPSRYVQGVNLPCSCTAHSLDLRTEPSVSPLVGQTSSDTLLLSREIGPPLKSESCAPQGILYPIAHNSIAGEAWANDETQIRTTSNQYGRTFCDDGPAYDRLHPQGNLHPDKCEGSFVPYFESGLVGGGKIESVPTGASDKIYYGQNGMGALALDVFNLASLVPDNTVLLFTLCGSNPQKAIQGNVFKAQHDTCSIAGDGLISWIGLRYKDYWRFQDALQYTRELAVCLQYFGALQEYGPSEHWSHDDHGQYYSAPAAMQNGP